MIVFKEVEMMYLFDTNIFIRSKHELPADVWPTFWERVSELIRDGKIYSSVKVKEEIDKGNDELTEWMKNNASEDFYYEIDGDVVKKYSEVVNWANANPLYNPAAKKEFSEVADAFLVATASAKNLTLVTFEKPAPDSRKRVKIPDACNALGVNYCDLNTAFRDLDVII